MSDEEGWCTVRICDGCDENRKIVNHNIKMQPVNGSCLYFGINWDYSFLHGFSQNQEGLQALSAFPCTAGIFVTTLKRLSTA
jgi:hypothetical protein